MNTKEKTTEVIRSLSGLVTYQGLVVGISDEFQGLFIRNGANDHFYNFSTANLKSANYLEQKKVKQDHESVSVVDIDGSQRLVVLPSFSKSNRNKVCIYTIEGLYSDSPSITEKTIHLPKLLEHLSKGDHLVNIEGHFICNDALYLLNRGNQHSVNEFIKIDSARDWLKMADSSGSDEHVNYSLSRFSVDLGCFDGHQIQWTDCLYEQGATFVFLATVEKTSNSYDDGDVICSFIGRYDFSARRLLSIKKIIDFKKAEGICIWNSRYLVCIDSDSEEMSNEFYSFPLNLLD